MAAFIPQGGRPLGSSAVKVNDALSMVLSDRSLKEEIARGRLVIRPLIPLCLQPASLDVHLGRKLLIFPEADLPDLIDVKGPTEGLLTQWIYRGKAHSFSSPILLSWRAP